MIRTKNGIFGNPLYIYSVLIAAIMELVSLFFIGWSPLFIYGLALGTAVSIVSYSFLVFSSNLALIKGKGIGLIILGYVVRLFIYGGVFLVSYKSGMVSGIATLLGYMTIKLVLFYEYGFKPGTASKKYDKTAIKDLDNDQWAAETEKRPRKNRVKKAFTTLQSDDWKEWLNSKDNVQGDNKADKDSKEE